MHLLRKPRALTINFLNLLIVLEFLFISLEPILQTLNPKYETILVL